MIRIIHLIPSLNVGGAEVMLVKLLSKIDRSQFEPVVISLSNHGPLGRVIECLRIPVFALGLHSGRPTGIAICRSISLSRKLKPDVIQGWMTYGNLASQLSAIFASSHVPVIWNIRQSIYSMAYYKKITAGLIKIGAYISGQPEAIVYNSKVGADHHEALGYQKEKRVIIPNGFEVDLFKPNPDAAASVREELNIPLDAFIIGLVANFNPLKDHSTFLKAVSRLLESHWNVHFLLAGFGVDGSNERLRNLIARLNISRNVHLLGLRSDIPRLTAAMNLATCSSYAEGFPNVIGEAMSCGVPCVVTDVGDSSRIVGDTGFVVPPKNPQALVKGWIKFIEKSAIDRQKHGELARKRIIEHFSINAIVLQYERLYHEVFYGQKR